MKIEFLYLKGKSSAWAEDAANDYVTKIEKFFSFSRIALKSKSSDRDHSADKTAADSNAILAKLSDSDTVILFDESGKTFKNSVEFSKELIKFLGRQSPKVVFIIGGPYGFSEEIKNRAQARWSLSPLTMNHHVAQVAALEQIYRALTIWRGLPYHNE
jgi:23S rRNA (pseudouridine1915-N3)-methyltransferase